MKLLARNKSQKGFTLVELLVVIGILAVLLGITLVAVNPNQQFAQARNTQRRSDVAEILKAVNAYMADNNGVVPATVTTTLQTISNTGANLCSLLVPNYVADLPKDPTTGTTTPANTTPCTSATAYSTGYQIIRTATGNRLTVSAPGAEAINGTTPVISVTR